MTQEGSVMKNMRFSKVLLTMVACGTFGCEMGKKGSESAILESKNPEPTSLESLSTLGSCLPKEILTMRALKANPHVLPDFSKSVKLKDVQPSLFKTVTEGGPGSNNIRVDVCADENFEKFRISKVIVVTPDKKQVVIHQKQNNIKTSNLEEFMFGNDPLQLEAVSEDGFRLDVETVSSKIVNPPKNPDEVFIPEMMSMAVLRSVSSNAVISAYQGNLDMGNPFGLCGMDGEISEGFSEFKLGTAKLRFDLCLPTGESQGIFYDVMKITVQDSSPNLSEADQKPIVLEKNQLTNEVYMDKKHHHNSCDSFKLTLPHATYFATAATLQGESACGTVVPGAIQLKDNGKVGAFKILYSNGKKVEELKGGFVHYLVDFLVRI